MNRTQIREIMTAEVKTLEKGQAAPAAKELLRMLDVRHLPVVNKTGELVGIVTHRQLLAEHARLLQQATVDNPSTEDDKELDLSIPISKVMETNVQSVTEETFVADALEQMLRHRVGSLPVVDQDHKVVGIVTSFDFLSFQLAKLRNERDESVVSTQATSSVDEEERLSARLIEVVDDRLQNAIGSRVTWLLRIAVVTLLSLLLSLYIAWRESAPDTEPAATARDAMLSPTTSNNALPPGRQPRDASLLQDRSSLPSTETMTSSRRPLGFPGFEPASAIAREAAVPVAGDSKAASDGPRARDAGRRRFEKRKPSWVPEPVPEHYRRRR